MTAPPPAATRTPRRRWLQYSLRTLLVLLSLGCVAAWLVSTLREHYREGQRQKEAIAWVEGLGGVLEYDDDATQQDWRRRWLSAWYPPVVVGVDFYVREVEEPPYLRGQRIYDPTKIGDLSPLLIFAELERFDLRDTEVEGIEPLAKLPNLRELRLQECHGWETLEPVGQTKSLRSLDLTTCWVSDLTPLLELPELRELSLHGIRRVHDLSLISQLVQLEKLDLSHTPNPNLYDLSELVNLQELRLVGTRVYDLEPLTNLHKLRKLYLSETITREERVVALRAALPKCEIISPFDER